MATRRQRKVADLLHEEISQILHYEIRDPRLGFVTVTGVDITSDLRLAKVFITVLGDEVDVQETLAGLASATGYLKRKLGQGLTLRHVPELVFKLDTSLERGLHIEALLDQIRDSADTADHASDAGPND